MSYAWSFGKLAAILASAYNLEQKGHTETKTE